MRETEEIFRRISLEAQWKFFCREHPDIPRRPDGTFELLDGKEAPIIMCFVKQGERILLLKRSDEVAYYKRDVERGYWLFRGSKQVSLESRS